MRTVDLRSDTVTQPTQAMKQAMIEAPLGDDVFGDDPTVARLEALAAELAGKEASMFVPSGTMANAVAIRLHTQPGDEVLLEESTHPYNYETGGPAVISGVQLRPIPGRNGILDPDAVRAAIRPPNDHFAPARLLSVEDTSNGGGGTVHPLDRLDALAEVAHANGLRTHMDGARAFNAAIASNIPLARRAAGYDTVAFCLSKGLGAPAGSMLCGPADLIATGKRIRKMLGGTMRQTGMLAAAGIYALTHHVERLAEDHARARQLSMALLMAGFDVQLPQTNIIYFNTPDAPAVQARFAEHGVALLAFGPTRIRMVTHLDVDQGAVVRALGAIDAIARGR